MAATIARGERGPNASCRLLILLSPFAVASKAAAGDGARTLLLLLLLLPPPALLLPLLMPPVLSLLLAEAAKGDISDRRPTQPVASLLLRLWPDRAQRRLPGNALLPVVLLPASSLGLTDADGGAARSAACCC